MTARSSLEGEHKSVTVLFCDIADSTFLADRIGPGAMYELLNRFFDLVLGEIHRYDGTVNQFLGDGFMAIFGAPLALEHHERQALLAAAGIVRRLSERMSAVVGAAAIDGGIGVRLGLNTGLVVVGKIGDNLRMDYTAVGDTTNVAARLQGQAAPGEILLSQHTFDRVQRLIETVPLGPVELKGKRVPVHAHRLVALKTVRDTVGGTAGRPLSHFVGRERELAELREALEAAEAGHGQAIGLVSEPGMGKSRLLWEFRQNLEVGRVTYLEGQCLSYGTAIPYLPILDVLRGNGRIAQTDTPEVVTAKVRDAVGEVGMNADASMPYLLHLLGVKEETGPLASLSPEAVQARTFETLRQLCLKGSSRRPIVFVIEDLHWIDHTSEDFVTLLVESLAGARILFLATYRPGYAPSWINKSYATQIALRPLAERNSLAIVQSLLDAHGMPETTAREIVSRGEGNPLFLEELAHAIGERGETARSVPETLQGVLTARIDRLPDDAKHLLQVAAVLGREFSERLLAAVWENPATLESLLRRVTRLEFLYERTWEVEPTYAFKHALTAEAAYASLLDGRRRDLHAVVGRRLEELYADRFDEVVEMLAHHYGRSDDDDRAVDYAIRASERAQKRWANTEALAHSDAALRRLEAMPDSEANRLRRIDAVVKQAEVRFAMGLHADQIEALERIRPLAEQCTDAARRAAWHYWLGFLHSLTGSRPEIAIQYCQLALDLDPSDDLDQGIAPYAFSCLTQVYVLTGEFRRALEVGEKAVGAFERRGDHWWAGRTLGHLSPAANGLGAWERSLGYGRRVFAHAEALDDKRLRITALLRVASTLVQRAGEGDVDESLRTCDRALALAPGPFDAAAARAVRGYALARARRDQSDLAELREALDWFDRSHLRYTFCQVSLWLAEAYVLNGDHARARTMVGPVVETARTLGYRYLEGVARRLAAETEGDEGLAFDHVDQAAHLLRETGARPDLARALLVAAELHRRCGRKEREASCLSEARSLLASVDSTLP